jgi:hypothetical protein
MRTYEINYLNEDKEIVLTQHIPAKSHKAACNEARKQAPEDSASFQVELTDF